MLGFDPDSRIMSHAIQRATNLSPSKIREFGVVSFVYAGLFLTEGIGLWLTKRWAEWFTVVITSSLVPLEIYEVFHRPTPIKVLVLIINVAVVAYLLYRIANKRQVARNDRVRRWPTCSAADDVAVFLGRQRSHFRPPLAAREDANRVPLLFQ